MTSALAVPDQSVISVTQLANVVRALYSDVFKSGVDYGVIPGTGNKPTLLQPGMEKLMRAMNAVPAYREVCVIRDYDRPLFHYEYECTLTDADSGQPIPGGRAIGLATSMEGKWRWRNAQRVCPTCGKTTIIKGKEEYGGGWVCLKNKGGCGAKFADNATVITEQVVGRVENTDIFDQLNTITKIAQKRAMASAVKGAANVSELFTVDLEDLATYPAFERAPDQDTGEIITVQAEVVTATTTPPPAPINGWTRDQANSLATEARNNGVDDAELLRLLGVERVSEYAPGFTAARAELKKYLKARPAPPADGTEPEQVHF